jgi:hypothetical protein
LVPFNRKNGDDLMNLGQKKDPKKPSNKINPNHPTGLVPPPTTPDVN